MSVNAGEIGQLKKNGPEGTIASAPAERRSLSLGEAIVIFLRHFSPRIMLAAAIAAWGFRAWLGGWTVWDAVIAGAIFAFWPVQEWLIHVHLLHKKPFMLRGKKRDLYMARMHRAHHRNPWKLALIFIPPPAAVVGMIGAFVLAKLLLPGWRLELTGVAVFMTLSFHYEWAHYLPHSQYKPKSRYYKRICELHLLHHFKNENYWYGVSMTGGDVLLKTQPRKEDVPTSTTVRTVIPV